MSATPRKTLATMRGRPISNAEAAWTEQRVRELLARDLSRGAALCIALHELDAQPREVAA